MTAPRVFSEICGDNMGLALSVKLQGLGFKSDTLAVTTHVPEAFS